MKQPLTIWYEWKATQHQKKCLAAKQKTKCTSGVLCIGTASRRQPSSRSCPQREHNQNVLMKNTGSWLQETTLTPSATPFGLASLVHVKGCLDSCPALPALTCLPRPPVVPVQLQRGTVGYCFPLPCTSTEAFIFQWAFQLYWHNFGVVGESRGTGVKKSDWRQQTSQLVSLPN